MPEQNLPLIFSQDDNIKLLEAASCDERKKCSVRASRIFRKKKSKIDSFGDFSHALKEFAQKMTLILIFVKNAKPGDRDASFY